MTCTRAGRLQEHLRNETERSTSRAFLSLAEDATQTLATRAEISVLSVFLLFVEFDQALDGLDHLFNFPVRVGGFFGLLQRVSCPNQIIRSCGHHVSSFSALAFQ